MIQLLLHWLQTGLREFCLQTCSACWFPWTKIMLVVRYLPPLHSRSKSVFFCYRSSQLSGQTIWKKGLNIINRFLVPRYSLNEVLWKLKLFKIKRYNIVIELVIWWNYLIYNKINLEKLIVSLVLVLEHYYNPTAIARWHSSQTFTTPRPSLRSYTQNEIK